MHKAQPLFEGRLRCSDVPHMTFLSYMLYYSEKKLKGETIPKEVLALMTDYGALTVGQKSINPLNKDEITKLLISVL